MNKRFLAFAIFLCPWFIILFPMEFSLWAYQSAGTPPSFTAIDSHARTTPAAKESDIPTLASHLFSKAKNDTEKARAAYVWITDRVAYNVEAFRMGKYGENDAVAVLKNRTCVCEGYARLYKALCDEAKLECVQVRGHARDGKLDQEGKPSQNTHAWNAVKLEGKWRLIDSTFGAGAVNGNEFKKHFEPMFFLASPEQLRFTHLPLDNQWQLLSPAIGKEDFDKYPLIRPTLFRMGFTPAAVQKSLANPKFKEFADSYDTPGVNIKVREAPLHKNLKAGAVYRLVLESTDIARAVCAMDNKVLQVFTRNGKIHTTQIKAPPGKLVIGVQKTTQKNEFSYLLSYTVE